MPRCICRCGSDMDAAFNERKTIAAPKRPVVSELEVLYAAPKQGGIAMRPFEGIRVIDATHVLAGPFAAYQLGVLGADVIKVEDPERSRPEPRLGHRQGAQPQRHGHVVPHPGLQQALDRARPQDRARPRNPQRAGQDRRRVRRELPARRVRGAGARLRRPCQDQSAADLRLVLRLRPGRPARHADRLRPRHPGHLRHHGDDRHQGRATRSSSARRRSTTRPA